MGRRGNASNPISHQKWQLNSSLELNKLKRSLFEKLPDTKVAFNKNESAAANMANLGLVYKLDDKERSLVNYKYEQKKNAILDVAPPKPFTLAVPESLGKRTEPMMMREWDYDYCGPLVTVYGTNYKAMSRDLKRNYKQKSEAELRKLCEKYVEFKSFGEAKLNELETLAKEQDAIERQGTILGAPSNIVEGGAKNNTTNNENQTKRKRADEAADSKADNKEQPKENTKKDSKPTPAKKVNKEETQTPAKKAKKDEGEETPAKKAKKVDTPAKKVETPAKKVTKEEQPKPTTQTKKQLATKQTETKLATKTQTESKTKKVEPKKVEAKKPEKKVDNKKQQEEDSDMDGMEFDFNEGDLSSDEE